MLGVGITSIAAKLFRKHFLDTKKTGGSYWEDCKEERKDAYYRQF